VRSQEAVIPGCQFLEFDIEFYFASDSEVSLVFLVFIFSLGFEMTGGPSLRPFATPDDHHSSPFSWILPSILPARLCRRPEGRLTYNKHEPYFFLSLFFSLPVAIYLPLVHPPVGVFPPSPSFGMMSGRLPTEPHKSRFRLPPSRQCRIFHRSSNPPE